MERIQKILSQAGVASRRAAEQLMLQGRVSVNGVAVRELGTKADPSHDDIRVDGRRVRVVQRHRYVLLYKPTGYITTRSDPQRRPTVMDLLGRVPEYIYPVGRLDFDTEGLLLLTNDGDLAARLTHPRHGVLRVYEATVAGVPDAHDLDRLRKGVTIEGRRASAADVRLAAPRGRSRAGSSGRHDHATILITVAEGRNRQVRRMCEAIGHPVDTLKRVAIGPIRDVRLKPGEWRELSGDEVRALQSASRTQDEKPARRTRARASRSRGGSDRTGA